MRKNLGWVFNSRRGHVHEIHPCCNWAKLPNLKLKTWPSQLLGSLRLDIALPGLMFLFLQKEICARNFVVGRWHRHHIKNRLNNSIYLPILLGLVSTISGHCRNTLQRASASSGDKTKQAGWEGSGTPHLYVIQTEAQRGHHWKGKQNNL